MRPGIRYDQKVWEREAEVEAEPARLLLERETIMVPISIRRVSIP